MSNKSITQFMHKPALSYMLCCFIALLITPISTAANELLQLKEQIWLSPDISPKNRLDALSKKPVACINPDAPKVSTIGRLAFESPALLGGQAARIGLSCASCHPSGRTSRHFFLENISSSPGTADVTHSFFSSTGGNDKLTAVAIPDLAKLEKIKIKDRTSNEFIKKLRELIEIEFDGQRAPKLIIDALQTYLSNVDTQYCQITGEQLKPHKLNHDWERLLESVNALTEYPGQEVNQLLIRIARKRLETIYLRYANIKDPTINSDLISLSRQLAELSLSKIKHTKQIKSLKHWHSNASKLFVRLERYENNSMYDSEVLTKLIATQARNK